MKNLTLLSDEAFLSECEKVAIASNLSSSLYKMFPLLKDHLNADEQLLAFSFGYVDGSGLNSLITLTDSRILFLKKRFFGGVKKFELKLAGIEHYQFEKGFLTYKVSIGLKNYRVITGQFDKSSAANFDLALDSAYDSLVVEPLPSSYIGKGHTHVESKSQQMDDFDATLTTIWQGTSVDVSFTYEKWNNDLHKYEKSRRTISPTGVFLNDDGEFYIRGICHSSRESRTFKQERIRTMMQVKSNRYLFGEWCGEVLNIDLEKLCPNAMWVCP